MNGETGTGTLESVGVHLYLFAVPLTVKLVPQQIVWPSGPVGQPPPGSHSHSFPISATPCPAILHYCGLLYGTTYLIKIHGHAPHH